MFKRANNLTDHILQWELTTTVQAINNYCMGIISFSETHINYKIELRLIPMHRLMYPPPPERGSWIPMGNATLLKTRLDSLPISKYLVSKILWWVIIFVRTSRKVSNVPTAFLGVLYNSHGL